MEKFTRHTGIVAPLLRDNIDTDAIIPSREMKAVSKYGLGDGLFAGWRYLSPDSREPDPDFVLNKAPCRDATILLAGENFGCGSSREHAVWAFKEYGFRAIIAAGFGGIFFNNCVANGILPVVLTGSEIATLAKLLTNEPRTYDPRTYEPRTYKPRVSIDLENNRVSCSDWHTRFELAEEPRRMLLEGLDPIDLTLRHKAAIDAFEAADRQMRPWAKIRRA